jgi:tetratricopeptide (TPR) repeat protein
MSREQGPSMQELIPAAPLKGPAGAAGIVAAALSVAIIGAFTAAVHTRNAVYDTDATFWGSAVELSPDKRRTRESYGQALSDAGASAGDKTEAIKLYHEALRQYQMEMSLPADGRTPLHDLYRRIGVIRFQLEEYDEAIAAWRTGLSYAPRDPSLLTNLSIALLRKGRYEEAIVYAENALAEDPLLPQALNTLGRLYAVRNEHAKALDNFLKAIELQPDVSAQYWNAALALEQLKQYEQALRFVRQYISMERNDPAAQQRAIEKIENLDRMLKKR